MFPLPDVLYRTIFDTTENFTAIVNRDTTILHVNTAFARILGYAPECIEGISQITDFVHPEDRAVVYSYHKLRRVDPEAPPRTYEVRFVDRQGIEHNILLTASLIPGTACSVLSGMDLTSWKQAEEARYRSEQRYRSLVEHHPNSLLIYVDDAIVFANHAAEELLGAASQDIIGKRFLDFIPSEERSATRRLLAQKKLEGKKAPVSEKKILRPDGRKIDVEIAIVPTEYEGRPASQIIMRDITLQKKAELQVRSWNNQMAVLNKIIGLANSSLNLDEMLEIILDNTASLLGFDAGCIYLKNQNGKTADLIVAQGMPERFCEEERSVNIRDWPYNVVFFAGQPRYVENLPGTPPGKIESRILEEIDACAFAGIPLITESVVVGALYVVRRGRDRFSEDEKATLDTIGREIGGTILRGMLQDQLERAYEETSCYLDIIERSIRRSNDALLTYVRAVQEIGCPTESCADMIAGSLRQTTELISNISTIRRINEMPEELDVISLDRVVEKVVSSFPEGIVTVEGFRTDVYADEFLQDLFSNLITNSIKFGDPSVQVVIRWEAEEGIVRVTVEDTGPGIPDELKGTIFSCFDPATRRCTKRGLGLHIVQVLVQRYGGQIHAEDRIPGASRRGLAIRFTLIEAPEQE
ncbi:MAG: PAS domain S-box protein [Methanomicrobiales archaeon]|nr:PAS domain S-box protein [Methanomicrobiales archaeon]